MERFLAGIKRQAAAMDAQAGQPRWGIVQNVDPSRPAVRVLMQPEGVLSGWLPVVQPSAGPGVSSGVIPLAGWMAFVLPDLGDAEHGVVIGFAHNDGATLPKPPNAPGTGGTPSTTPAPLVAGEWFITAFGSTVRLCANGDLLLVPGSGTVKIDGNLTVNGYVRAQGAIVAGYGGGDQVGVQTHTHTQPADTHGDTEAPTNAPTAGT